MRFLHVILIFICILDTSIYFYIHNFSGTTYFLSAPTPSEPPIMINVVSHMLRRSLNVGKSDVHEKCSMKCLRKIRTI